MPRPPTRLAALAAVVVLVLAACDDGGEMTVAPAAAPDGVASPADAPEDLATADESPAPAATPVPANAPHTDDPAAHQPTLGPRDVVANRPGTATYTMEVDGRPRTFTVVVPAVADLNPPLVLAFHGFSQSAERFLRLTRFDLEAEEDGFVVILPDGVQNSWNGGGCCGFAGNEGIDDVAFARALVQVAVEDLGVDPQRVVATGFSNGGWLSHRIACEAPDLVIGVVPQSGPLEVDCNPSAAVPVRHLHGSSDLLVPQSTGARSIDAWARIHGCTDVVEDTDDGDGIQGVTWTGCADGVEVAFLLHRGVAHDWIRGPEGTKAVVQELLAAATP